MKKLLPIFLSFSIVFCSVYNTGETISIAHQNIEFDVCFGDYDNDYLKLADFNGDLNGGYYHVIYINTAASW